MNTEAESVRLLQRGFSLSNVAYHINDYVYIHPPPRENSLLLKIGQIVEVSGPISDIQIRVRYLERYNDTPQMEKEKKMMDNEVSQITEYLNF